MGGPMPAAAGGGGGGGGYPGGPLAGGAYPTGGASPATGGSGTPAAVAPPSTPKPGALPAVPGAYIPTSQRIDPHHIPRPKYTNPAKPIRYKTSGEGTNVPPPAWADYIAEDTGNVNPRFLRCTLGHVPATRDLLRDSAVPLALVVNPLAPQHPDEARVQVVDFGSDGPIRCGRCRGYISPFCKWKEGGRVWVCALCSMANEAPADYQAGIDQYGLRRDRGMRPELSCCSVEFVAPPSYILRQPYPLAVLFVVDVSFPAVLSGATKAALEAVSASVNILAARADCGISPGVRAGLLAYDHLLHWYDLTPTRREPREAVSSDVDDAFAALPPDQAMPPVASSRHAWAALLGTVLPRQFTTHPSRYASASANCGGAALKAAVEAVGEVGGRVVTFAHSLPTVGEGKLPHRERFPQAYEKHDTEKTLLAPAAGSPAAAWYAELGKTAAARGVAVHLNVLGCGYMDLASAAPVASFSGGDIHTYPWFTAPTFTGTGTAAPAGAAAAAGGGAAGTAAGASAGGPPVGAGAFGRPPTGAPTAPGTLAPPAPAGYTPGAAATGGASAATSPSSAFASASGGPGPEQMAKLIGDVSGLFTRELGTEAVLKVRTSPGLRMTRYLGNFTERGSFDGSEVDLGGIDGDKALVAILQHDGNEFREGDDLYVQAAMLFTNEAGSRRIRVHNLRLVGTENVQSVFRHADIDAILSLFIRDAATALISKPPATVANDLIAPSIDMLFSYRKNCAPNSSPGQLILPDSLKLLPCYLAALFKTDAFAVNKPAARGLVPTAAGGAAAAAGRGMALPGAAGPAGGGAAAAASPPEPYVVRADTRIAQLVALNCIAPALLIPLVYPRLFVLHNMGGVQGLAFDSDDDLAAAAAPEAPPRPAHPHTALSSHHLARVVLPPTVFPSVLPMQRGGIYLLEHASGLYLYPGPDADEERLRDLLGPAAAATRAAPGGGGSSSLPELDTDFSMRVWCVISALRARRSSYLPVYVVSPGDAPACDYFLRLLAEDSAGDSKSYVDVLCDMHTAILERLQSTKAS